MTKKKRSISLVVELFSRKHLVTITTVRGPTKVINFFVEVHFLKLISSLKVFDEHLNKHDITHLLLFTRLSTKSSLIARKFIALCGSDVSSLKLTV